MVRAAKKSVGRPPVTSTAPHRLSPRHDALGPVAECRGRGRIGVLAADIAPSRIPGARDVRACGYCRYDGTRGAQEEDPAERGAGARGPGEPLPRELDMDAVRLCGCSRVSVLHRDQPRPARQRTELDCPRCGRRALRDLRTWPNADAQEGATFDVQVRLGPLRVFSQKFDLCETLRENNVTVQCPVAPGHYDVTHTVYLPQQIPPGRSVALTQRNSASMSQVRRRTVV